MKMINTGKGKITVITLLAIWSISLVVDLPGLAITPVMSDIDKIFPHASDLEIQLLSVLPNFCILPFILLAGKMSVSKSKLWLICLGMAIFLGAGIACFFAKSLTALIIISCFIGVGCGIVIPLAAGVIADLFVGEQRMKQMGIKSGIANFSLIIATLVVGWIGAKNWHLPFIVYLIPVVPLVLAPFLTKGYLKRTATPSELESTTTDTPQETADKTTDQSSAQADSSVQTKANTSVQAKANTSVQAKTSTDPALQAVMSSESKRKRSIAGIMVFYFITTFCTIVVSYYAPFAMQDFGMPLWWSGLVTSIFFLFITLAGFCLTKFVKIVGNSTSWVCMALMIGGLVLMALVHTLWAYIIGAIIAGMGYGTMQPIFYDKGALLAKSSSTATNTLSYIMTASYLGTAVAPLLMTGIKDLLHLSGNVYAFWLGAIILVIPLIWYLIERKSYIFYVSVEDC